jgi:sugar transferase (PEP-CTERM/EpsH1 system associated)
MKLLFLTSRLPFPLDKGDKLRAYHFIKELSKKHEIVLFSLNDESASHEAEQEMLKYCKRVEVYQLSKLTIFSNLVRNVFKKLPFQVAYFFHQKAELRLQELIRQEQPDLVFYQLVRMAEYAVNTNIPKAMDYMDVLSVGVKKRVDQESLFKKFVFAMEHQRLTHYEQAVFNRFAKHFIITEQDRAQIPHNDRNHIEIISNGVDLTYFHPASEKKKSVYDVVFSGNMGYPPNIVCAEYLVNQVMPLVWKHQPQAKVAIVGTSPSAAVLALASDKVTVTGRVADIRKYFYESKMFAGPLFMNTGLQNKLLESMALGIPCITSTLANNALKGKPGHDVLIADDAPAFANAILDLMQDETKRNHIAKNAELFVNQHHHWSNIGEQLSKELESIRKK